MERKQSAIDLNGSLPDAIYSLAISIVRAMPRDISLASVAILYLLERDGPQRITSLAKIEGIKQPSMTTLITRLERAKLVERVVDTSDGRAVLVKINKNGHQYLEKRREVAHHLLDEKINSLPELYSKTLFEALPAIELLTLQFGLFPISSGNPTKPSSQNSKGKS